MTTPTKGWARRAFARPLALVLAASGGVAAIGAPRAAAGDAPAVIGSVSVAAAASVEPVLRELAPAFERATGNRVDVSAGSTGKLATQVVQGAPFEVLLAADDEHPRLLEEKGLAVASSRFTWGRGRLVLWSARPGRHLGAGTLRAGRFAHLAIADPGTAPYGEAAVAVLRGLGVYGAIEPKLVRGESAGQTFAFVKNGAAELGFVALSQLFGERGGSRWLVPEELHQPLVHQAVLLAAGRDDPAAQAFLRFLRAAAAKEILRRYGYVVP